MGFVEEVNNIAAGINFKDIKISAMCDYRVLISVKVLCIQAAWMTSCALIVLETQMHAPADCY